MKKRLVSLFTVFILLISLLPTSLALAATDSITLDPITDKAPGDEVILSGTTTLSEVNIKVLRPNNTILYIDIVEPQSGEFLNQFTLPIDSRSGSYKVIVGEATTIASQQFEVAPGNQEPPLSNNALLSDLKISTGTIEFQSDRFNYSPGVANSVNSIKVTPTAAHLKSTIKVNGHAVASGQPSAAINLPNVIPAINTITVVVTAEDGTTTKEYVLSIRRAAPPIEVTESGRTISVNEPTSLTIPEGVNDVKVKVDPNRLQVVTVQAETDLGTISLEIPEGTVSGPAGWDGEIKLPTVKETNSVSVPNASSVSAVIEVGFSGGKLVFDKAVKLVIPGQASKAAGYVDHTGKFTSITTKLNSCTQEVADALPAGGDAYCTEGSNLVIWTKHFTKFVSYTEKASGGSVGSSSGGGGSATTSDSKSITASSGGSFTNDGAKIEIPSNALSNNFKVTVKKVSNTSNLPTAENSKIVGDVYEFTKDKSGNFDKAVTITLPYDKSKVDTEKYELGIFWFNEATKEWVKLDNVKVDLNAGKVSGEVVHFTKFAVLAVAKKQTQIDEPKQPETTVELEDIKGHWAEKEIAYLVSKGAINGFPDGTFKPNNKISRAEFASITVNALGLTCGEGKVFSDTKGHWAQDCVSTAVSNGIVVGLTDDKFGPNEPITREQMAVIIARAAKLEVPEANTTFKDDAKIAPWAKASVAAAAKASLVGGLPDGSFNPKGSATRAEAAAMITRLIK